MNNLTTDDIQMIVALIEERIDSLTHLQEQDRPVKLIQQLDGILDKICSAPVVRLQTWAEDH